MYEEKSWKSIVIEMAIQFACMLLAAWLFNELFFNAELHKSIVTWLPKLTGVVRLWLVTLIGTASVLLIGLGLFFFKKHYQQFYGMAEIAFALAAGWASLNRAQVVGDLASWLAVLAAAYLTVRGLSNYDEGRTRRIW